MPQIGQVPGASRTTSGCMGHVHSVPSANARGSKNSRAIRKSNTSPGRPGARPDASGRRTWRPPSSPPWFVPSSDPPFRLSLNGRLVPRLQEGSLAGPQRKARALKTLYRGTQISVTYQPYP
jgi:hypothetical protein